jgi:PAS domain S-box-containing protein
MIGLSPRHLEPKKPTGGAGVASAMGGGKLAFISSENRILFGVVISLSLVFLIVAVVIYQRLQQILQDNYDAFGNQLVSVVALDATDRMEGGLSPELKLKALADNLMLLSDDVSGVEFYDADGKLLVETKREAPRGFALTPAKPLMDFAAPLRTMAGATPGEPDLEGTMPRDAAPTAIGPSAVGSGPMLGEVHLKLNGHTLNDIAGATKTTVLVVFFSAWIVSIVAVFLNTYILSKHLRRLVRGVQHLSTGDFGYKINESDLWGELKQLAELFNDMSVRLRNYEDQNLDTITFERNKLEAVLLSIADGVVVCDMTGEMIIINESACAMLGAAHSRQLVGMPIQQYIAVDSSRPFETVINEFDKLCAEYHSKLPEAFSRQVTMPGLSIRVIVSPIHDADGQNLGFVMIMHDVTKAVEVDKLKTNFISNVSHELRTPVTTIKSYVDTLYNHGKELDEETYHEFLETIHLETDRLKKLVNDILDFSRLEEGNIALDKEFCEIAPIINLTAQSVKLLAEQKNLTITMAIESGLPALPINSDSIERALRNLLSNAIKYTPDGGRIKIRADLSPPDTQGHQYLVVAVQDTGIGIPEEHLPHIFDRFYRVENKVHTVKGTGLGLHLVKMTVEKHHQGQVFVESTPGQGSTFGFKLPLKPAETPKPVEAGLAG